MPQTCQHLLIMACIINILLVLYLIFCIYALLGCFSPLVILIKGFTALLAFFKKSIFNFVGICYCYFIHLLSSHHLSM